MPIGTFTSPGAAVADTVSQILDQKKAEARQAMLDQLNQRNVESEMASRAENARSQAEARAAMADQRQAQKEQGIVDRFDKSGMEPNTDLTQYGVDDETITALRKYGRVKTGQVPAVGGETEGTNNVVPEFTGTPDQQKQARIRENAGKVLSAMSQNPNMSPTERLMRLSQAFESPLNGTEVAATLKQPDKRKLYDAASGKFIDMPEGTTDVTVVPRPPAGPAPANDQLVPEVDPKTGIQTGKFWTFNPRTRKMELMEGPTPAGTKAPPGAGKAGGSQVPASTTALLARLRGKTVSSPGFFGTSFGGTTPAPGDVANFNQAVEDVVSRYQTDPDTKDTVRDILVHESPETPTDEIIKRIEAGGHVTPKQVEDLRDLLSVVRGQ